MNRNIDLNETHFKTALKIMMAESEISSIATIARELDMKETTLRSAINNNAIRLNDFLNVAKHMGYTLLITKEKK